MFSVLYITPNSIANCTFQNFQERKTLYLADEGERIAFTMFEITK